MSQLRAIRTLNALQMGALNSAALETALTTGQQQGEWSGLMQSPGQVRRLVANTTAITAAAGSNTATAEMASSDFFVRAMSVSEVAQTALSASVTYHSAIVNRQQARDVALSSTLHKAMVSASALVGYLYAPYWTYPAKTASGAASGFAKIRYIGGQFFGCNVVLTGPATSPDGVTWTTRNGGTNAFIYDVAYNGSNLHVGVSQASAGITPRSCRSSDGGVTWTGNTVITGFAADEHAFGVAYGASLFVACGVAGKISTTPDGVTWTSRTSNTTQYLSDVAFNGSNLFVAVGAGGAVVTSPDGITWTSRTSNTTQVLNSVTYGAGLWVAVGNSGAIVTSPDGITWTVRTVAGLAGNTLTSVSYANSTFVITSSTAGSLATSSNGTAWTSVALPSMNAINWAVYGAGYWWFTTGSSNLLYRNF